MMRLPVLCGAIFLITSAATAAPQEVDAPFGIALGQKIETLDAVESKEIYNLYEFRSVPKPHPLLVRYTARASASAGVCAVSGYTAKDRDVVRDREVLREYITTLLGEPRTFRLSNVMSVWAWEPKDSPVHIVQIYWMPSAPAGQTVIPQFAQTVRIEFASAQSGQLCGLGLRKQAPPPTP